MSHPHTCTPVHGGFNYAEKCLFPQEFGSSWVVTTHSLKTMWVVAEIPVRIRSSYVSGTGHVLLMMMMRRRRIMMMTQLYATDNCQRAASRGGNLIKLCAKVPRRIESRIDVT